MFPGGIPKKVGWSPEAASYAAPPAPAPAPAPTYAYPAAVPGMFNRYRAANTAASQAIPWHQVAEGQAIRLAQAERNLASRLGIPESNVMAKARRSGTYFTVHATGSQGQPQETHYSMHQPSQWGSTSVGQFHMRTHNTNTQRPRYEARAVPTAPTAQGGPFGFGSFITPKSNFNRAQRGEPGYYPYPQGHPVPTTIAPALAQTAASYQQGAYGFGQAPVTSGLFSFTGARGGQEGKRRRRAKSKRHRKANRKTRKH